MSQFHYKELKTIRGISYLPTVYTALLISTSYSRPTEIRLNTTPYSTVLTYVLPVNNHSTITENKYWVNAGIISDLIYDITQNLSARHRLSRKIIQQLLDKEWEPKTFPHQSGMVKACLRTIFSCWETLLCNVLGACVWVVGVCLILRLPTTTFIHIGDGNDFS